MKFKYTIDVKKDRISFASDLISKTTQKSIKTVAQDLARTSSESAPHFKGDLEDAYSIEYSMSGGKFTAVVDYAVRKGSFNYAIAMHEWTYRLGEGSARKGGGTGMSGKSYFVGRKYLTRVLNGEAKAYRDYIEEQIRKGLGGL